MAHTTEKAEQAAEVQVDAQVQEDRRKPYEPPKLLKKRSVARATLFTARGVMSSGLTMTG
jgi:hypothetical protein